MISATVIGNLGKDAELRDAGNTRVCSFGVASTEKKKDSEVTTWVRCSLWGDRGEKLAKHLTKGTRVAVSGSLSTREYEGKTYFELRVDQLEFVGERKQSANNRPQAKQQPLPTQDDSADLADDNIPF